MFCRRSVYHDHISLGRRRGRRRRILRSTSKTDRPKEERDFQSNEERRSVVGWLVVPVAGACYMTQDRRTSRVARCRFFWSPLFFFQMVWHSRGFQRLVRLQFVPRFAPVHPNRGPLSINLTRAVTETMKNPFARSNEWVVMVVGNLWLFLQL